MKNKLKLLLRWAGCFVLCFIVIYITVLLGGYKLFSSGDPIFIELGVALVLSFFVFGFDEAFRGLEKKVKTLEQRIEELEEKQ